MDMQGENYANTGWRRRRRRIVYGSRRIYHGGRGVHGCGVIMSMVPSMVPFWFIVFFVPRERRRDEDPGNDNGECEKSHGAYGLTGNPGMFPRSIQRYPPGL